MKKTIAALLSVLVLVPALAACTPTATVTTTAAPSAATTAAAPAANKVEMKKISAADAAALIGKPGYKFIDLRKAADVAISTVKSAVPADLSAAVEGDTASGIAALKEVTNGSADQLVLVCYTGNKYAQAATDALSAIGYDMSKVVTLDGGFKEFSASQAALVEKK